MAWLLTRTLVIGSDAWISLNSESDVELDIIACGICHSDVSTATGGWGPTKYPITVGHEIVGIVTRVGKDVKHLKVGDRAGVGAQSGSCLKCRPCVEFEREPNCTEGPIGTYNGVYKDGSRSQGGYAKGWRGPGHFTIPIPEGLESHIAAPLMCGGITAYGPLSENGVGSKEVKKVGIVGIGGIGAFGIAFAKALGAEQIVAISRSESKKKEALELGATEILATGAGEGWEKKYRKELDFILVTSNEPTMPLDKYTTMLRPFGKVVVIGIPEGGLKTPTPLGQLIQNNTFVGGSMMGGVKLIKEMLQLAADKRDSINFMIEKRDMKEANQAVKDMQEGKPRFRYSLIN